MKVGMRFDIPARPLSSDDRIRILLCAITSSMLLLIEMKHPYYFLQADNRIQNLPYFIANYRAVAHLEFPLFNFHQLLGTPLFSCIQSAGFYPMNYIAVFVSNLLWGHIYGTMEVLAFFHMNVAALGFYHFMKVFHLKPASCFFGAIAWTFCGFVLSVGDSWIHLIEYSAYLPWAYWLLFKIMRQFNVRIFIAWVAVRASMFFLGVPQIFVYHSVLETLTIFLCFMMKNPVSPADSTRDGMDARHPFPFGEGNGFRFAKIYMAHYLSVLLIVLPALLPALHQMSISAERSHSLTWDMYFSYAYNIIDWVRGVIHPSVESAMMSDSSQGPYFDSRIASHIGYLTAICFVFAVVRRRRAVTAKYISIFFVSAILTLLLASNETVFRFFYHVPLFNRFRWPFKWAYFTGFYMIIVGSFGFDIFSRKTVNATLIGRRVKTLLIPVLVGIHVMNFLYLYAFLPHKMIALHLDKIPLEDPWVENMKDGRIASIGFDYYSGHDIMTGHTASSIGFNYATLWNVYHFGGYELLISEKNLRAINLLNKTAIIPAETGRPLDINKIVPLSHLRDWSVKWYVVDKNVDINNLENLKCVYIDPYRNIFVDTLAKPFVYWENERLGDDVNYKFKTNSIEIRTSNHSEGNIRVTVLHNPFFRAYVDGERVEVKETTEHQMALYVPAGSHILKIVYFDPYFYYGLMASLIFLASAVMGLYYLVPGEGRGISDTRTRDELL